VHNPELPAVGPLREQFMREADVSERRVSQTLPHPMLDGSRVDLCQRQIRQGVWTVCGVAMSNDSVPPAMVVGCMAIHLCREADHKHQMRAN
jgi:hypothetical protein